MGTGSENSHRYDPFSHQRVLLGVDLERFAPGIVQGCFAFSQFV